MLDRLGISSADSARVTQINATLSREYQKLATTLGLGHDEADLIFTAADPIVDLPDDCGVILTVRVGTTVLRRISRQQIASVVAAGSSGAPVAYVMESPTRIRIVPAPTANDSTGAVLAYAVRPVTWTLDADTPSLLPEEFHDLVAELTVVRIAMSDEEPAMAQGAQAVAAGLLADLKTFLSSRVGTIPAQIPVPGLL